MTNSSNEHIVLLHGLARTSRSMRSLQRFLEAQHYHVHNLDYPSRHHKIEDLFAQHLAPQIEKLQKKFPKQTIHFVTHSMGGILVRAYLAKHVMPNLGRVVMLSPPNQGTEIVDRLRHLPGFSLINGPASLELGTDPMAVPQKLTPVNFALGVITGNKSLNFLFSRILTGANDGIVSEAHAKVQGMHDFLVVPHSHTFIMNAKMVHEQTLHFLRQGKFR